jgi:F-box-like
MAADAQLSFYAYQSNEPLPVQLYSSLSTHLDRLDHQNQACRQHSERINEAIEEKQSAIQALEKEIQCLERAGQAFLATAASIAAKKVPYEATLSPIRRTPPEIIAKILAFAINGTGGYLGQAERLCFRNLRAVCQLWRETAFSTPNLWQRLVLVGNDFRQLKPLENEIRARQVTSWLQRGGDGAPLRLNMSWVPPDVATLVITNIRNARLNLHSLIMGLESRAASTNLAFLLKPTPDASVLPLRDLQIHFTNLAEHAASQLASFNLDNHLPNLFTLSLSSTRRGRPGLYPASFSHTGLTGLSLTQIRLLEDDVEVVLSGLVCLEVLRLIKCTPFRAGSRDVEPYLHQSLKRIEIFEGVPGRFLSRLGCPRLKFLSVAGQTWDPPVLELEYLREFIGRCNPSVELVWYGRTVGGSNS